MNLSIVIPTYNNVCVSLVKALHAQAEKLTQRLEGFGYEIIVADDGSIDKATVERNEEINSLPRCRYIVRPRNAGRAAIRNFLAQTAQYEWLLFIDSDRKPGSDAFIEKYINTNAASPVVEGGLIVHGDPSELRNNLRFTVEKKYEKSHSAAERRMKPYQNFNTSNFFIRRDTLLRHPFDERFSRYGYEDVMLGKTLREHGVAITHIDNPIIIYQYETNADFISKTEEGLNTLFAFRHELRGYSSLISATERIERLHLTQAISLLHRLLGKSIRNTLKGNKTSVLLFNIYKLGYFCHLLIGARKPKT